MKFRETYVYNNEQVTAYWQLSWRRRLIEFLFPYFRREGRAEREARMQREYRKALKLPEAK